MGRKRRKNRWKTIYMYTPPALRTYLIERAKSEKKTLTQVSVELILESPTVPRDVTQAVIEQDFQVGKKRTAPQDYMANLAEKSKDDIIAYLKEHPHSSITIEKVQEIATIKPKGSRTTITDRTARKYINDLEAQGLVRKEYRGTGGKLYVRLQEDTIS